MLTIKEICEQTGISNHTFQSWRRNDSELLPQPVGVAKKIIYFDESILERIRFILAQRATGKKLAEIEVLVQQQLEDEFIESYDPGVYDDDGGQLMDQIKAVTEKWEQGDCKNDICLALKLDPVISGWPEMLSHPFSSPSYDRALVVFVSIISNGFVHFAELHVTINNEIKVNQRAKLNVSDFGMLLCIMGRIFAEQNMFVSADHIPFMLFANDDIYGLQKYFDKEILEQAQKFASILQAGLEFVNTYEKP